MARTGRAHTRGSAVRAAPVEVVRSRRCHRRGLTFIGHELPPDRRPRGARWRVAAFHSLSPRCAGEYCRFHGRPQPEGERRMSEVRAAIGRPLNSPRAAALAGVLFAVLFTTALALMRSALPD